ncbi:MAG: asparagine synthase (glutamine-hydrolyzing) [Candidatus Omnitrophota bacterium]|jgi:asparagine synthase (glutamine-hydrolysing)
MCGIFGFIYKDTARPVDPELIKSMGKVLHHRGPDNLGVLTKGNVGLGHTRLSIIDLSSLGNQPMSNEDGTVWITFNGEIYNFRDIKNYLINKGHKFRSHTDTEVVIHLWEEEGVRCVERLRGMFAFAIWDGNSKSLFIARDRVGKKPLFYAVLPDRFLFASEIKAILQDPLFKKEPDIEAIHHYLAYQSVPSPFSAFKGIKKLPPAHYLLLKDDPAEPVRYWKLSYKDKLQIKTGKDIADLENEIIDRLREAVRLRLMSDVPLGAFLSGGIDSSIVTALMAGLMEQPVKTFSIGFEQDEYNELPYARMVAERYGTEHHEFIVTPDAEVIFPELVWHYNEPFADSSAIPTYYVCKLARQHVTVILNGDGGDENFAGYPRYTNEGEFAPKRDFPSLVKRWLMHKGMWAAFACSGNGFWNNIKRLKSLNRQRLLYYYRITHFHEFYKTLLYSENMKKMTDGIFSVDIMLDKYRHSDARDFLDATLGLDFELYLPDTLMTKVDIASMAHSLEARSPFLDHEFMEFAAKIPSDLKLKGGLESKYIFKRAAEPYLPHDVIYRKKMGFGVPIDHWFRSELKGMVYDLLLSRKAIERGYFRKDYIEHILDSHQKGANWHYHIWNLLMLELWHLMFIDGTLSPPPEKSIP